MRLKALLVPALLPALFAMASAAEIAPRDRRSGFEDLGPETRAMQRDDEINPAMLWVRDGAELWASAPSAGVPACSGCHGEAASLRGVAARYPAWDAASRRPIDLQGRIAQCRQDRQNATPFGYESRELLGLTAFVAMQSRGLPIAPVDEAGLAPAREEGRALFMRRIGQLGLACADCHDDHWGRRLGAATIPQAHPTGYPLYRLEWQGLGSLQRRLRNCMTGMRAEPYPYGAAELVVLELYLMDRAAGLPVETPAVRP